eukprot:3698973-Rhodomonas_salina.1
MPSRPCALVPPPFPPSECPARPRRSHDALSVRAYGRPTLAAATLLIVGLLDVCTMRVQASAAPSRYPSAWGGQDAGITPPTFSKSQSDRQGQIPAFAEAGYQNPDTADPEDALERLEEVAAQFEGMQVGPRILYFCAQNPVVTSGWNEQEQSLKIFDEMAKVQEESERLISAIEDTIPTEAERQQITERNMHLISRVADQQVRCASPMLVYPRVADEQVRGVSPRLVYPQIPHARFCPAGVDTGAA